MCSTYSNNIIYYTTLNGTAVYSCRSHRGAHKYRYSKTVPPRKKKYTE